MSFLCYLVVFGVLVWVFTAVFQQNSCSFVGKSNSYLEAQTHAILSSSSMEDQNTEAKADNCTETTKLASMNPEQEDLRRFVAPNIDDLPLKPPSAVEANFVSYFAPDVVKPGHDQYIYRHANGLCVIGLAPTHAAFKDEGGIITVDFNVGKSDRSGFKVSGKRKKNAQFFEPNTALCKVFTKEASYIVRCCVKGSLLEVNERLIKDPQLLNSLANREGYIAILMPRPSDWLKIKDSLLNSDDYKKLRQIC